MSRSGDKGHLKVKHGPKRKPHIIQLFVFFCDKFNCNHII